MDALEEQETGGILETARGTVLGLIAAAGVLAWLLVSQGGETGMGGGRSPRLATTSAGEHVETRGDAFEQLTRPHTVPTGAASGHEQTMGGMAELYREQAAQARASAELEDRMGGMAELYCDQERERNSIRVGHGP